jgi:Holliday junction resolvase RusA-like endonuclease
VINFFVDGLPVPQGSMKVINGRVIHNKGSELAAWRSAIALTARQKGARPLTDPMYIHIKFYLPKPRTVKRLHPSVAPDLDKLIRAVLDGLTAIAYVDDGQVVSIVAEKAYGERIGADVSIGPRVPEQMF